MYNGKIIQILVGKQDLEKIGKPKSPNYEEYLPVYTILERINEDLKEIIVKKYEDNIIVEIAKDFKEKNLNEIFELKEELFDLCENYMKKYVDNNIYESYTIYSFSNYNDPEKFINDNIQNILKLLKNQFDNVPKDYIKELLDNRIKYSDKDLILLEWDNGLILDKNEDFKEEIDIIELACVRLLNLRIFDRILKEQIEELLSKDISSLNYFKLRDMSKDIFDKRLKYLSYFDSMENTIIFYGDRYYVELYNRICDIFSINEWTNRIEKKLNMIEDIYEMINNNMTEFYELVLEFTIVLLIVLEIVFAMFKIM